MKKIVLTALAAATLTASIATTASASCYRYGNYVSCSDGNSYSTWGNTTYGSNSRTGSTWSQSTYGGYTFGTDASGNSWSSW